MSDEDEGEIGSWRRHNIRRLLEAGEIACRVQLTRVEGDAWEALRCVGRRGCSQRDERKSESSEDKRRMHFENV